MGHRGGRVWPLRHVRILAGTFQSWKLDKGVSRGGGPERGDR